MLFATESHGDLIFVTVIPPDGEGKSEENIRRVYTELSDYLKTRKAELLQERVYGTVAAAETILRARHDVLAQNGPTPMFPATYVEGMPFDGSEFSGIHAVAVSPPASSGTAFVLRDGIPCGSVYQGGEADYLCLSDVGRFLPETARDCPDREAQETILLADRILAEANWSYHNVLRTWFYLDNILGWYPAFNRVRNEMYKRLGLFNGNPKTLIPASTGIWGRNTRGNWCTLDLMAMRPQPGHVFQTRRLFNPKQNEAIEYGSAFSRGVSVTLDSGSVIFISGTASIDERGVSLHPNDMERQTERTLLNVGALLESAGARFEHIVQATAFVKRAEDIPVFQKVAKRMELSTIPMICTIADVCRDDLLFELDATAILPSSK